MNTRTFFVVTALVEAGAGAALAASPSAAAAFVFGSPLSTAEGVAVGRIAGAALFALGAACWLSRDDAESRSATGLLRAMLLYNGAAAAVLAHAGIVSGLFGLALWPGLILHATLSVWCIACLRSGR
jgi:hypothetical protein